MPTKFLCRQCERLTASENCGLLIAYSWFPRKPDQPEVDLAETSTGWTCSAFLAKGTNTPKSSRCVI